MDQGLFSKHIKKFQEILDNKNYIIKIIKEYTGVILNENEVTISKKEIIINTTSVKKNILVQKNYKDILNKKGFILK